MVLATIVVMYLLFSESRGGRELHEDFGFLGYIAFM
jgi:hypothetical protein